METTKQYIAVDSIIARPTNNVRVIVAAASGCWASELKAVETALPSPSAGPITPMLIVRPAVIIDMIAIRVRLSIISPRLYFLVGVTFANPKSRDHLPGPAPSFFESMSNPEGLPGSSGGTHGIRPHIVRRGRSNVNCGKNAENISLDHASQQAERTQDDRKNKGADSEQNGENHCAAHHIAEQANSESKCAR